jgi:hypothetical protein
MGYVVYTYNMMNLLLLIPAFIAGYLACYFVMTSGIDQGDSN